MRTKTLLLFVFLLTGMAFSQQGGTGFMSLEKITRLLRLSTYEKMQDTLKAWGYDSYNGHRFRKGKEWFQILPEENNFKSGNYKYLDTRPSVERREEIVTQAKNARFKVETEIPGDLITLINSLYLVEISTKGGIQIRILR